MANAAALHALVVSVHAQDNDASMLAFMLSWVVHQRHQSTELPSGAPSETTMSANSPSKWDMTSLAVSSLVMSPCI